MAAALVFLAPLANCACANSVASRARRRHVRAETESYIHAGRRSEVAKDASDLLTERGYPSDGGVRPAGMTTQWKETGKARSRIHIVVLERSEGYAVRMTEERQQQAPPKWVPESTQRDDELESAVLERVYPGKRTGMPTDQVLNFEYSIAPDILWDATQEELGRRGEWLSSSGLLIDHTTTTRWVVREQADELRRVRHELAIVRASDATYQLQAHRVTERGEGPRAWRAVDERRNLDLEYALLRKRDPRRAAEIEDEARRKAEETYEAAQDLGLLSCGRGP